MARLRSDGLEIFLESDRDGSIGPMSLWTATRSSADDQFDEIVPVANLNVMYAWQTGPWISADGHTLYFASDRIGTFASASRSSLSPNGFSSVVLAPADRSASLPSPRQMHARMFALGERARISRISASAPRSPPSMSMMAASKAPSACSARGLAGIANAHALPTGVLQSRLEHLAEICLGEQQNACDGGTD